MTKPASLYHAIGDAAGCRALATAFYRRVEREPLLRPLFPSTFTCAIEEFAAFLVQFLGGESGAAHRRWWLSLRESHDRFRIGPNERDAWLRAMRETLDDEMLIPDDGVRRELLDFFTQASTHVVNQGQVPRADQVASAELAELWREQLAVDELVAAIGSPDDGARCIELFGNHVLQSRFARSPATHASLIALATASNAPALREYALGRLRAMPSLVHERYNGWRSVLHDACAAGDTALAALVLDLGWIESADATKGHSPLYCVANECSGAGAGELVRLLVHKAAARVNGAEGAKRCTALHMAARRNNVEAIEALLEHGADIEARDSSGETPLRRAVNCNQVAAAKVLIARGADRHSTSSKGLTPARAARTPQMKELVNQLSIDAARPGA